jgi:hypothetical protein
VLSVPRSWSELTPAWVTEALAPVWPGVRVRAVEVVGRADGTNARATLRLTHAGAPAPERVFIKREGSWVNRLALTALRAREAEVELTTSGIALPLEHPRLLAAAADRSRLATVVVLEDVTLRGARPLSLLEPLGPDEVAAGLAQLAGLHAAYWGRPVPASIRPWRQGPVWGPVASAGFARAHQVLRGLGRGELVVDAPRALSRGFLGWAGLAASGPQTLLHGDPHLANAYAVGDTVGFYDWQLVRRGSWVHDVGYFLVSALTPADRRAHERALLAGYLTALGPAAPAWADAWAGYRRTPVFGLGSWLQTLAGGGFQPREVCLAAIERYAAAYTDLAAPGLSKG